MKRDTILKKNSIKVFVVVSRLCELIYKVFQNMVPFALNTSICCGNIKQVQTKYVNLPFLVQTGVLG